MLKRHHYSVLGLFFMLVTLSYCGSEGNSDGIGIILGESSCEEKEPADFCAIPAQTNILVLIDKSASVRWDENRKQDQLDFLQEELQQLKKSGDRIQGSFIHENTRGAAPFLQKVHRVECPLCADYADKGRATQARFQKKFTEANAALHANYFQSIAENWNLDNVKSTKRNTDIWGSLEVMANFFSTANAGDENKVFLLSDMLESNKGRGRRDFTNGAPTNRSMAEEFAAADVAWIEKELKFDKTRLSDLQITVLANNTATDANNFATVKLYWEALFQRLGVKQPLQYR